MWRHALTGKKGFGPFFLFLIFVCLSSYSYADAYNDQCWTNRVTNSNEAVIDDYCQNASPNNDCRIKDSGTSFIAQWYTDNGAGGTCGPICPHPEYWDQQNYSCRHPCEDGEQMFNGQCLPVNECPEEGQPVIDDEYQSCDVPEDSCETGQYYYLGGCICPDGQTCGNSSSSQSSEQSSQQQSSENNSEQNSSAPSSQTQSSDNSNSSQNSSGDSSNGSNSSDGSNNSDGSGSNNSDGSNNSSGSGSSSGNQASGGEGCDQPPQCSGDEALCALLHQQWLTRCERPTQNMQPGEFDESVTQNKIAEKKAELEATINQIKSEAESLLSVAVNGGSGQLPERELNNKFGQHTIGLNWLAPLVNNIGLIIIAIAYIFAAIIIFKK